jgi:flagellar biosynthesis/type III secretory pathway chaperone
MRRLDDIKKVLGEQILGCRQMMDLLQREKVCLMDMQMEGLESITKEKDSLVLKLRLLEEERLRLVDRLIAEDHQDLWRKGDDPGKITLQKLAEITGETIFREIRSKLVSLSQSIKELNDLNKMMIDRTLNFLRSNNTFFASVHAGNSLPGGKGGLLSREI